MGPTKTQPKTAFPMRERPQLGGYAQRPQSNPMSEVYHDDPGYDDEPYNNQSYPEKEPYSEKGGPYADQSGPYNEQGGYEGGAYPEGGAYLEGAEFRDDPYDDRYNERYDSRYRDDPQYAGRQYPVEGHHKGYTDA